MLNKKTIDDIDVKGKEVLVRCDFNVPMDDTVITDDTRIRAAIPTIKKLSDDGGRLILCSHLGKPKGKSSKSLSLEPVAKRLSELLDKDVKFVPDQFIAGAKALTYSERLNDGDIMMLENTRFNAGEEKNDPIFARALSTMADIYVNDAFGTAHRAHSSTVGVTEYVDTCVMGYLLEKETKFLSNAVENAERPFAAIMGGAKISSKIPVIENLLDKVDVLIIGGGMAYTFIKAQGGNVGKSLVDEEYLEYTKEMVAKAKEKGVTLLLPVDTVIASELAEGVESETVNIMNIPDDKMGVDIGEASVELFAKSLMTAKTVLWNGPMGVFEIPDFAQGTKAIASLLAELDAVTIVGGGDSVAAINQMGLNDKFTHISTGGGASLELLEGKDLPGIAALDDKE